MLISRFGRFGTFLFRFALSAVLALACVPAVDAQQRPRPAWAANINVNSLSDPGTGICDLDECTLREAILAANSAAGADWIKVVPNGTITLTAALPVITEAITLDATDRIFRVEGVSVFQVFSATAPVTMTNVIIQNGLASGFDGGGAYFGDAAVLTDVTFRNNTVTAANRGGGAYFVGHATVTGGLFSGNNGGAAGGGAYFQGTAVVSGTTFLSNTATGGAGNGGGAYFAQPAWVTNTLLAGNIGNAGGGAVFVDTSTVTNASFVGNHSQAGHGGGAMIGGIGTLVTNALFEANSAATNGGGIALVDSGDGATVTLATSRVWANSAATNGGGVYVGAGTIASLDNNVLAANIVPALAVGTEVSLAGVGAHVTGRHNTLASAATASGTALSAGTGGAGQTVVLTNTIFHNYQVGAAVGPMTPTIVLDGVLWSSIITPTQGAGITVTGATTGNAAFTNPSIRNFHITGASAAINNGLSTGLAVDFDGDSRPSGLAPDLGADEYISLTQAPPEPVDDTLTTAEDTAGIISVLSNDTDPNNDTLTLSAVGPSASGLATISGTTHIVYTPTLNFFGTDVFTYSVTDSSFTSTAAVSVTVTPINDAPTISDVSDITLTVSPISGALPFTVGDVEAGGAVTVTAQSNNLALMPNANIVLAGSGVSRTVTVAPVAGRGGQLTITLTVVDDQLASAESSFVVTVYFRRFVPLFRR